VRIEDQVVDPTKPEALQFAPIEGEYNLVAVSFWPAR